MIEAKRNKLLYTDYGDGASKGFKEVENIYVDSRCSNYQKGMSTGGKGKLTNAMTDKLQNY